MKGVQTYPIPLKPCTFVAGAREPIALDTIPPTLLGGINHVESIDLVTSVTPTLSSGTLTPEEAQNCVTSFVVNDGLQNRCNVSFALLRFIEMYQEGRLASADPDALATTEAGYFVRRWNPGPRGFMGDPSDYLLPAAGLKGGRLEFGYGALTDMDANCTAATVTIQPIANCVPLYGEFRVPPLCKWEFFDLAAANFDIPGKALHHSIAMFNSSSYDAISAGDFANFTLTGSAGVIGAATHAADLSRLFNVAKASGHITPVRGEPRAATDDNQKVVNSGTPTALTAATANINPVLWYGRDARITKIRAYAESQLKIQWSGTQTSGRLLSGRIEAQAEAARSAFVARTLSVLGMTKKAMGIKTLSKLPYKGDVGDFMPWTVKV